MFGIERLQTIRELVIHNKSVEVAKLSKEMKVSEVTIRRDLDKLEKEGLVVKTYGGAILAEDMITPSYSSKSESANTEEEMFDKSIVNVAMTAARLIEDGNTVFIDGGVLGRALIRQLSDVEDLIVITNNVEIAYYLFKETNHKVVMIGGEIEDGSGNVTEYDQLDDFLIEKVFISVDGIDLEVGYTVSERNFSRMFKKLKLVTKDLNVMIDSSVFDKRSLVKMSPMDGIGTVITDKYIPERYKTYYYEKNITVHTSILSQL